MRAPSYLPRVKATNRSRTYVCPSVQLVVSRSSAYTGYTPGSGWSRAVVIAITRTILPSVHSHARWVARSTTAPCEVVGHVSGSGGAWVGRGAPEAPIAGGAVLVPMPVPAPTGVHHAAPGEATPIAATTLLTAATAATTGRLTKASLAERAGPMQASPVRASSRRHHGVVTASSGRRARPGRARPGPWRSAGPAARRR